MFVVCSKERDMLLEAVTEGPLVQYLKMSPITDDWPEIDDPTPAITPEAVSGTSRLSDEDRQDESC